MTRAGDKQSRSRWEACLMTSPFILGGAVALLFGIRNLWLALESPAWPTVPGVILISQLEHREEYTFPKIEFRYVVDNRRMQGSDVGYGVVTNVQRAQGLLLKYPIGKEVSVYYQPSNPDHSVLEPGFHYGGLLLPLLGLLLLIPPGFIVLIAPKMLTWGNRFAAADKSALAADQTAFAGKWRLISASEDYEPPWRNAAYFRNWRTRGSRVILEVRGSKLIALPRSVWKEASGLALFTLVLGAILYFIGVPDWLTGLLLGIPVLIMTVLAANLLRIKIVGNPLVIDRESCVVSLPPFMREFPFSSVLAFQRKWIRSISLYSKRNPGSDLQPAHSRENGTSLSDIPCCTNLRDPKFARSWPSPVCRSNN